MPHYERMFPSKYIRASDLCGKNVTLTIQRVAVADLTRVGGAREALPHLWFDETDKMMVLNKTNARTIAELYGPDTDNWPGKRVTLYPADGVPAFGGGTTTAIRLRDRVPSPRRNPAGQPEPPPEAFQDGDDEPPEDYPMGDAWEPEGAQP